MVYLCVHNEQQLAVHYHPTYNEATDIMTAQGGSTVGTYTLENLELEYESITDLSTFAEVPESYTLQVEA